MAELHRWRSTLGGYALPVAIDPRKRKMSIMQETQTDEVLPARDNGRAVARPGQIVLVFQGGGALGAYQAGVYQALHQAGIEPDWVIGTSIGAINASIIAGNRVQDRLAKLQEFWQRLQRGITHDVSYLWPEFFAAMSDWTSLVHGVPGLFGPNPFALLGTHFPLGTQRAAFYSAAPLERTLLDLVDFSLISRGSPRVTIRAANVLTSEMHYFDSREMPLTVKHVMTSGTLPPAFPAVHVDGEYCWDGGILSNTPTEVIFEDHPRRD